ncbi:MAG: hypothetical protein AB8G16_07565 [Gammaproteobacteria bacterium]
MPKHIDKLLAKHRELTHSEMKKVVSHAQRETDGWFLNTLMIEDCDTPFRYKRRKRYQDLKNARVDLTYYPTTHTVAGIEMDAFNVVRIRRS